jgi:hypothetical protein
MTPLLNGRSLKVAWPRKWMDFLIMLYHRRKNMWVFSDILQGDIQSLIHNDMSFVDTFIKNQYTSNKHRDTKIVESKWYPILSDTVYSCCIPMNAYIKGSFKLPTFWKIRRLIWLKEWWALFFSFVFTRQKI